MLEDEDLVECEVILIQDAKRELFGWDDEGETFRPNRALRIYILIGLAGYILFYIFLFRSKYNLLSGSICYVLTTIPLFLFVYYSIKYMYIKNRSKFARIVKFLFYLISFSALLFYFDIVFMAGYFLVDLVYIGLLLGISFYFSMRTKKRIK